MVKGYPNDSASLPAQRFWSCYSYCGVFAHLLIIKYLDYHQNLIHSSIYYRGTSHKISSQSIYNIFSIIIKVVHKQTDRQTNATKNNSTDVDIFMMQIAP